MSVGNPVGDFDRFRFSLQLENSGRTARDIEIMTRSHFPSGTTETIERVVDGVPIATGVDHLNDEELAADFVHPLEGVNVFEDRFFHLTQGQFLAGKTQTGDGQSRKASAGIG